jgi:hypothetical protein
LELPQISADFFLHHSYNVETSWSARQTLQPTSRSTASCSDRLEVPTLYASRGTCGYDQWRGHRRRAGWRKEEACGWLKVWYCSWHSLIFQKFSNYGILSIWHQDSNSSQVHPARDDSRLICDCLTHSYYRFVAHQFDRFNIFARTSSMLQQLHLQVLNLSMQPPSPSPISQATCCVCRK